MRSGGPRRKGGSNIERDCPSGVPVEIALDVVALVEAADYTGPAWFIPSVNVALAHCQSFFQIVGSWPENCHLVIVDINPGVGVAPIEARVVAEDLVQGSNQRIHEGVARRI